MDLLVERAVLGMKGLKKDTKIDLLTRILEKSVRPGPPPRDPRIDPQLGDMVRVPWKGAVQIRVVTEVEDHPLRGIRVRWNHEQTRKHGGTISLKGWQKITKDCTVLRTGVPK